MAQRRWGKILGTTVIILLILSSLAITFTIGWRPIIGPRTRALTDRKIEATPARLARGQYLVDSVMGCVGCHSDQDFSKPGAPPVANRRGRALSGRPQTHPGSSRPTLPRTKKRAPATGAMTHWHAPVQPILRFRSFRSIVIDLLFIPCSCPCLLTSDF